MLHRFRFSRGPLRWWLIACGLLFSVFDPLRLGLGLGMIAIGLALHVAAKACLWQNRILSTAGPYRFTRNPFYLANLLIDAGLLVVAGSAWLALVFAALWGIVYRQTIADEERTLEGLFGESYRAYCRRVPRLVPRPWQRLPSELSTGPALTWQNPNLITGTEWPRVCRIAACPWLLACAGAWRTAPQAALPLTLGCCGLGFWLTGELLALRIARRRAALVTNS